MKTSVIALIISAAALVPFQVLADQIKPQPPKCPPRKVEKLVIPRTQSPKLEASQQLPSDRLINRTFRF